MHLAHSHAMHMPHPAHWLQEHPLALALLIAGLITLLIVGLSLLVNTGIKPSTFDPFHYRAMLPFV